MMAFSQRFVENAKRISGILHVAIHGRNAHSEDVLPETALNAIRASFWFACRVNGLLNDPIAEKDNTKLARLIEKVKGSDYVHNKVVFKGAVKLSAIVHHGWDEEEVKALIKLSPGKININPSPNTKGRRGEVVWVPNPLGGKLCPSSMFGVN
jgi:hypothetical protein